jgi:membrane-associated phospholipid phosphatase
MDVAFLSDIFFKRLPRILSFVLHPILMPSLGVYLILHSGTYVSFLPPEGKNAIMAVMLICTFALPLTIIPIYYYRRVITSLHMDSPEERLVPMTITALMFCLAFFMLHRWGVPAIIQSFVLASTLVAFITLFVTFYWKISVHTAGIGGIIGLIVCLSVGYRIDMLFLLMTAILLSGIIGFSRLSLNAHSPAQVYIGLILGFLVTVTTICLF